MSALAKSLLAFNARFTVNHEGRVWVPEDQWQKFCELARREVPKNGCEEHGITDCLPCRRAREGR